MSSQSPRLPYRQLVARAAQELPWQPVLSSLQVDVKQVCVVFGARTRIAGASKNSLVVLVPRGSRRARALTGSGGLPSVRSGGMIACNPLLYLSLQSRLRAPAVAASPRQAVFLDRDGTIVEDVGYLTDPSRLRFLARSLEGIRILQGRFLIVIVTNQSAVARGLITEDGLLQIHRAMALAAQNRGITLDAIYACPHHPKCDSYPDDTCYCRKPQPGMFLRARDEFGIRLDVSFMIGDKVSDVVAAHRAGVPVTILTGSQKPDTEALVDVLPTYRASNLHEAAQLILAHRAQT